MKYSVDIFRHMVERSDEIICYHDSKGRYLYASPALKHILGFEEKDFLKRQLSDFVHPTDLPFVWEYLYKLIHYQKSEEYVEYRLRKSGGDYVWIKSHFELIRSDKGELENFISYSVNITGLKRTLHQLAKSESLLIEAGRMSKVGVWEVDLVANEIFWSRITYEIHEVDPRLKPTLDSAWSFYSGSDLEKLNEAFNMAVKENVPYDVTLSLISAKKNRKWVRTIGKPEQEDGKTVRIYGTFMDVTEQVSQEKKLEKAVVVLEKQKEQLNEFNQIVSHNLRSPVSNLNVLLDYIEDSDDDVQKEKFLQHLREVTNSLTNTLEDLSDVVKIIQDNNLPEENVSISTRVEKVKKQMFGHIKQKRATITLDASTWDIIQYSPVYMDSILSNLISNSLNYSDENRKPEIHIRTFVKDGIKALSVKDNGIGIDLKRHGKKLFKMHKTLHRHKSGKGMGLYLTKNHIEALGGSIEVLSEEGKGTEFIIYLNKEVDYADK